MSSAPGEPTRLLDEASSPVERALLEAGTSYRTNTALHAKTLAAIGIAGSAAFAEVASASLGHFAWAKWVASLSLMGATAAVPVAYYALQEKSTEATVAPQSVPRGTPQVSPSTPASVEEPSRPEARALAPTAPKSEPRRSSARADTLAKEVDAVDAARSALSRGEAGAALAALDAYSRTYPRGRLVLEAEVLRIDALSKSGQAEASRRRAQQFLRQYPKSVLSSRVRRLLGQ